MRDSSDHRPTHGHLFGSLDSDTITLVVRDMPDLWTAKALLQQRKRYNAVCFCGPRAMEALAACDRYGYIDPSMVVILCDQTDMRVVDGVVQSNTEAGRALLAKWSVAGEQRADGLRLAFQRKLSE